MDPSLEAILEQIFDSLTELTNERIQRVARINAVEKAAQMDRRLVVLERRVKN